MKSDMYLNFIIKFILSIVIIYISFTPKSFKELIKMIIFFYLTSFVFGGAALGMIYMVNMSNSSFYNCNFSI